MNKSIIVIISILLTACGTTIPSPKKPSKYPRVPINKTVPVELQNYLENGRETKD